MSLVSDCPFSETYSPRCHFSEKFISYLKNYVSSWESVTCYMLQLNLFILKCHSVCVHSILQFLSTKLVHQNEGFFCFLSEWENSIITPDIYLYTFFVNKKNYVNVWHLWMQQESNKKGNICSLVHCFVIYTIEDFELNFSSYYNFFLFRVHWFLLFLKGLSLLFLSDISTLLQSSQYFTPPLIADHRLSLWHIFAVSCIVQLYCFRIVFHRKYQL